MSKTSVTIRKMHQDDWYTVREIFIQGMNTGIASLEESAPDWESWNAGHLQACRLIAEQEGDTVGWLALSPVSTRCVYGGVAEVSVYVRENARGNNVGTRLLTASLRRSEAEGIWTLQAGILLENAASIALFKSCGFRLVGVREKIGRRNGIWHDVALYERRSPRVGIE
jgi:phosphinothricin acetyltransferase